MKETSTPANKWSAELKTFSEFGYIVLQQQFSQEMVSDMRNWIDEDLESWKQFLDVTSPNESGSLAHHVLVRPHWRNFLDALQPIELFSALLGATPIIHTFGVNDNRSDGGLYHHHNHVDQKFSSDEKLPSLLNLLVFVDDFTEAKGATWIYPKDIYGLNYVDNSDENGIQVCGQAGDLLIWDSRMLHRAGSNLLGSHRRGVSVMLSRPWIKPQMNYLAELSENEVSALSDNQKQLLGYGSRIPNSLEDWYFPKGQRFNESK